MINIFLSSQDSEIGCDQVEETDMTSEDDVILQFRIWEQGRVDMEDLIEKLQLMAQVRILCLKFSLNPLKFSLTREINIKITRAKS